MNMLDYMCYIIYYILYCIGHQRVLRGPAVGSGARLRRRDVAGRREPKTLTIGGNPLLYKEINYNRRKSLTTCLNRVEPEICIEFVNAEVFCIESTSPTPLYPRNGDTKGRPIIYA